MTEASTAPSMNAYKNSNKAKSENYMKRLIK
jgi:hypothetical protein